MKYSLTFFLSISIFLIFSCGETASESASEPKNNPYSISGQVENPVDSGIVTLSLFDPVTQKKTELSTNMMDTSGHYQLSFDFTEPDLFRLDFPNRQSVMLVIGEGQKDIKVNVEGKRNGNVEIIGSEDSEKLLGYDIFRNDSNKRLIKPAYDAMRAATDKGDTQGEVEAVQAYGKASYEHRKELIDYSMDNIGNSIALYGTMLRWTGDDEVEKLEKLVKDFEKAHPNLTMTSVMVDKVARYKKVAIGAIAPDFTLADTSGNNLNLKDLKGKYTLLDFWASWCSPCLLQVPDLKEAYGMYHEKGFEIVGVSVDSKGDRWKKAINKYEMNWPHVSDLKGWGSETAADYNVTFIPFNMLIDSEGKIIAKNLHSKELQGKLAELFSEG
jgi:peroxiredoxin